MTKHKTASLEEQIINQAIQSGVKTIIKNHPRFEGFQNYLIKHMDSEIIEEKFKGLYREAKQNKMREEEIPKFLYEELRDYIASGSVLDERGKETILKNSLEEKPRGMLENLAEFFGYHGKEDGEKYLHNTMEAFQDLYSLFQSGDYASRMPELTKSVSELYDLKFLDPAVDVLKSYGLIDKSKYKFLKQNIYKRIGKESENVVKGIERYVLPQAEKVVASILGITGAAILLFSSGITGAVIGSSKIAGGIIGGFVLLAISVFMFMTSSKSKFKRRQ